MGAKREAKKALSQRTMTLAVVTRQQATHRGRKKERKKRKRERLRKERERERLREKERDKEGERGRVNCRKTHVGTKREAKKALSQRTMMLASQCDATSHTHRDRKKRETEKRERKRETGKERESESERERERVDCRKRGDTHGGQTRGKESIAAECHHSGVRVVMQQATQREREKEKRERSRRRERESLRKERKRD